MNVEFMNIEKFHEFIRENASLEDYSMDYYLNELIITAIRGKGIYKLFGTDTKHNKSASIHFTHDRQYDEENEEEYMAIKFLD